jgi:ribose transport system substrate-binding protein
MRLFKTFIIIVAAVSFFCLAPLAQAQEETYRPGCFQPAPDNKALIKYEAHKPPYKLAFVNGYSGNDWRMTTIRGIKAWAARPENKAKYSEFRVVSVGNDSAAQIAAIDNYIASGYDAIVFLAVNPSAFDAVIRRADQAGVVLVPYDNIVDSDKIVLINEDQFELGRMKAQAVLDGIKAANNGEAKGRVLEVGGVAGSSVDRDNHEGMVSVFKNEPGIEFITMEGKWDAGTGQKVTADALATYGNLAGLIVQEGAIGPLTALENANHPVIPIGVDGGNGSRMIAVKKGYPGVSAAQAPVMSAVAMEAAIALLEGHTLPNKVFLPIPHKYLNELVEGVDYFPNLPDTFYTTTGYPQCFPVFTPEEILNQNADDS